jgi:hypothetical protein
MKLKIPKWKFKNWGKKKSIRKLQQIKKSITNSNKTEFRINERVDDEHILDLKCDAEIVGNKMKVENCQIQVKNNPLNPPPQEVVITSNQINQQPTNEQPSNNQPTNESGNESQ